MTNHIEKIRTLLVANNYPEVDEVKELPGSGSRRIYFRITFTDKGEKSILASYNPEIGENIAQFSFTIHFRNKGLKVPEIYAKDGSYQYFLLEDLGGSVLFDLLKEMDEEATTDIYKKVLDCLIDFQTLGIDGLDLEVAYPTSEFEMENIMWDLNYFKYYFLKTHNIIFDEHLLEKDFKSFATNLMEAKAEFFLYRDFQSRNILLKDGQPWFIDFQGGRKGPLQYDVVSLLYQAKANLSSNIKENLLKYYLDKLEKKTNESATDFLKFYPYFIYFRTMQVMGAYGFRGLVERKGHFLQSIPYAIDNLKHLLENKTLNIEIPELRQIFNQIVEIREYDKVESNKGEKLIVQINSFSFKKKGIPVDTSGNGGGHVFDCRSLPNPGRYKELRDFTGLQKPVIEFLEQKKEMDSFLTNCLNIVKGSLDNYLERGFGNLQVNFGCTGGKHRSVYSAEYISRAIQQLYKDKIDIRIRHRQIKKGM